MATPLEPPPPYSRSNPVAASSSSGAASRTAQPARTQKVRNGIPPDQRRSMEDESRPVPEGWVRQFDSETGHQFFVDTREKPPRSIWHHPYDDQQFLSTLSSEERERIESADMLSRTPSHADIIAESSDDDDSPAHHGKTQVGEPVKRQDSHPNGMERFGRKMKNKMTGTTHDQRKVDRAKREEEERKAYERHMILRRAMQRAIQTGKPQLVGKDKDGDDVYIKPPSQSSMGYGGLGGGYPGRYGYGNGGYMRPGYPYSRPYGYGYGGGLGLPLMGGMMLGGGLGMGMGMGMGGMGGGFGGGDMGGGGGGC